MTTTPRSWSERWLSVRPMALSLAVGIAIAAGVAAIPDGTPRGGGPQTLSALRTAQQIAAANGAGNAVTTSATTVKGRGSFADLSVTLGQTQDLVNQSVVVTWAWGGQNPGSRATIRNGSTVQANFMQIMQCWGDTAPDRTRCEFGGFQSLNTSGATRSASRRIFPPGFSGPATKDPVDPAESFCWPVKTGVCQDSGQRDFLFQGPPPEGGTPSWAVPFRPVTGDVFRHDGEALNPNYGEFDTNEIPYALTRPDGKGFETFELQTFRESAGLGCADIVTSGAQKGKPRSCWLVVVPRGTTEVNGKEYTDPDVGGQLQSSPLSLSNWNNRVQFKLSFQAIGQPCPIGAQQRLVGGVETSSEAVLRWQPALCRNGGAVYGYSKLADAVSENALTTTTTRGLSFLNAPLDPQAIPPDRTAVYAPVTLSGIAITALIERTPQPSSPPAERARQGERVTDIKLTPRLVAKLLTQSYGKAVDTNVPPGYIGGNPLNIDTDPEFLALNPEFKDLTMTRVQVVMPSGVAYTNKLLWQWIQSDDAARDFVAGVPDEFGMRVNPFYQGLDLPQDTLPKVDPYCRHDVSSFKFPNLCVRDMFPAVSDYKESARQVARGDTLELGWPSTKANATDPDFVRAPRQPPGTRATFGIADTATAGRFLLAPVRLRNASGAFVGPTDRGLLAGLAGMKPSGIPNVLTPDPATRNRNAYPLTVLTYAASTPNQLDATAAKDYATFIRYAAGPGQTRGAAAGTLPEGYVPLPQALRRQALAVADQVQRRVGPPPQPTPRPSSSSSSPAPAPSASPSVVPSSAPAPTATALPTPAPVAEKTPADALVNGVARFALIGALLLGSAGLLLGPLLPRIAERLRR